MNWTEHYPAFVKKINDVENDGDVKSTPEMTKQVEIADIGCGYGGLLFALSPKLPDKLILGLEIRTSVTDFVSEKIKALRSQNQPSSQEGPGMYSNISVLRANTMKFLPNFFHKAQLSNIFLCFPDPHFKARKHKARIVSSSLNSEYAFVLRPGGKVYTITDVEDLHAWMVEHFANHPSFERVGEGEVEGNECVAVMKAETEEGKKVERNGGVKYVAVFRRVEDPDRP